jgi:hypothetical protein
MIFRWLKRRRELAARVAAEAETMIALFGDSAYYEARSRALAAERRKHRDPYWAKVRREIARRTRRTTSIPPRDILSRDEESTTEKDALCASTCSPYLPALSNYSCCPKNRNPLHDLNSLHRVFLNC